jgi:beta-mannosidase
VKNNYLSFSYVVDGKVISFGTVLFTKPKHFHFVDPKLELSVNGDEITVKASAFARYVYIYNKNDDLILSDNFFDMNKGKKTVKIISGEAKDLAVKTVFDINKNN